MVADFPPSGDANQAIISSAIASGSSAQLALSTWKPSEMLESRSADEVRFSRGLFRCRPDNWFPGFVHHWLPLIHSLGIEFKLEGLSVSLTSPTSKPLFGYVGSFNGDPFTVCFADGGRERLIEQLLMQPNPIQGEFFVEYLVRRFISVAGLTWSGPEAPDSSATLQNIRQSMFRFEPDLHVAKIQTTAQINLRFFINRIAFEVYIGISRSLGERLDVLWRRQIHSSISLSKNPEDALIEVASIAISADSLASYTARDTLIDLECGVASESLMLMREKPILRGRLIRCEGYFGFEVIDDALPRPSLSRDSLLLSVVLPSVRLEPHELSELSQPGAILSTQYPLSPEVTVLLGSEKIASGQLGVFEGRLALRII